MSSDLILALSPHFYEKQVIHTWLDVVFPVACEVWPVYGAFLGMVPVKKALAMQQLPPSRNPEDDTIRVVSILVGRPTVKPDWTARIDKFLNGAVEGAAAVLLPKAGEPGPAPATMEPGELMVLDPRVLIRHRQSGAVTYHPRIAIADRHPFDGFMREWMRLHPEWPDVWLRDGSYPAPSPKPFPGMVAQDDVTLTADASERPNGEILERLQRRIPGQVMMEGV